MSAYEKLRSNNIERNQKFLDSLGIVKDIIPAKKSVIKKIKIINTETTNNRKSKRLRNFEEEEPILSSNNKLDEFCFYAPLELQEVRRCRIDSTNLRNFITNNNEIHNGFISEMVLFFFS
jgi:hypothetical protein